MRFLIINERKVFFYGLRFFFIVCNLYCFEAGSFQICIFFDTFICIMKRCDDFYVGDGAYSKKFNRNILERIVKDIGLVHASVSNLGSTW